MRFSKKSIAAIAIVALIVLSLLAWTITSPNILPVESESQLTHSLLQYARVLQAYNFSDGGGKYSFLFGLDYNTNATSRAPAAFIVYAVLTSQTLLSPFARGVTLQLQSAIVLLDNFSIPGLRIVTRSQPQLQIFQLTFSQLNVSEGLRRLTVRLIVSTVDINYVGYLAGTTELVVLSGSLLVG